MRKFRAISIPAYVNPIVRTLFEQMNREQLGVLDMSERSGINKNTIKEWRSRSLPNIANLEACYNVLGLTLKPTRMHDPSDEARP